MFVNFTDLNKECPKYSFLLPMIDTLVDSIAGKQTLSFTETFLGYN